MLSCIIYKESQYKAVRSKNNEQAEEDEMKGGSVSGGLRGSMSMFNNNKSRSGKYETKTSGGGGGGGGGYSSTEDEGGGGGMRDLWRRQRVDAETLRNRNQNDIPPRPTVIPVTSEEDEGRDLVDSTDDEERWRLQQRRLAMSSSVVKKKQ